MLKWQLSDKSIFYNNILVFLTALNAIPALFDDNYTASIGSDKSINLEGKITSQNHFKRLGLIKQMKAKFNTITDVTKILGQQLVISCYEVVKDQNDKSQEFEFFRHLRNGCAHENKFNFSIKEPSKPAKWQSLEITRNLQSQEVIFGFIGLGDIITFIQEIDKKVKRQQITRLS